MTAPDFFSKLSSSRLDESRSLSIEVRATCRNRNLWKKQAGTGKIPAKIMPKVPGDLAKFPGDLVKFPGDLAKFPADLAKFPRVLSCVFRRMWRLLPPLVPGFPRFPHFFVPLCILSEGPSDVFA